MSENEIPSDVGEITNELNSRLREDLDLDELPNAFDTPVPSSDHTPQHSQQAQQTADDAPLSEAELDREIAGYEVEMTRRQQVEADKHAFCAEVDRQKKAAVRLQDEMKSLLLLSGTNAKLTKDLDAAQQSLDTHKTLLSQRPTVEQLQNEQKRASVAQGVISKLREERDTLSTQVATAKSQSEAAISELEEATQTLQSEHDKAVTKLKADHDKAVTDLKVEQETKAGQTEAGIRSEHDSAIRELRSEHTSHLLTRDANMQREHQQVIATIKIEHAEEFASFQSDLDLITTALQSEHEKSEAALQSEYEREIASIRSDSAKRHVDLMNDHREEAAALKLDHERDTTKLRANHEKLELELRSTHKEEIASLTSKNDKTEADARTYITSLEKQQQTNIVELKSDHEKRQGALKAQLEEETTALKTQLKEETAALTTQREEETTALKTQLKEETAALKTQREEETAALTTQREEETASLKTQLKEETASLRLSHDVDIISLQATHDKLIDELKSEHDTSKATHEETIRNLETRCSRESEAYQAQYEREKRIWIGKNSDLDKQFQDLTVKKNDELDEIKLLCADLQKRNSDLNSKVFAYVDEKKAWSEREQILMDELEVAKNGTKIAQEALTEAQAEAELYKKNAEESLAQSESSRKEDAAAFETEKGGLSQKVDILDKALDESRLQHTDCAIAKQGLEESLQELDEAMKGSTQLRLQYRQRMLDLAQDVRHFKYLSDDLGGKFATAALDLTNSHAMLKRSFGVIQNLTANTRTLTHDLAASQIMSRGLRARVAELSAAYTSTATSLGSVVMLYVSTGKEYRAFRRTTLGTYGALRGEIDFKEEELSRSNSSSEKHTTDMSNKQGELEEASLKIMRLEREGARLEQAAKDAQAAKEEFQTQLSIREDKVRSLEDTVRDLDEKSKGAQERLGALTKKVSELSGTLRAAEVVDKARKELLVSCYVHAGFGPQTYEEGSAELDLDWTHDEPEVEMRRRLDDIEGVFKSMSSNQRVDRIARAEQTRAIEALIVRMDELKLAPAKAQVEEISALRDRNNRLETDLETLYNSSTDLHERFKTEVTHLQQQLAEYQEGFIAISSANTLHRTTLEAFVQRFHPDPSFASGWRSTNA